MLLAGLRRGAAASTSGTIQASGRGENPFGTLAGDLGASNTRAAQVPISGLTANVLSHQREECLAAGMDGVVGKPVPPTVLLQAHRQCDPAPP